MKVELQTLYSIKDVKKNFFPSRSPRWIHDEFCLGDYPGLVIRDGGGWMISAQAVHQYQAQHVVNIIPLRSSQHQFKKQFAPA